MSPEEHALLGEMWRECESLVGAAYVREAARNGFVSDDAQGLRRARRLIRNIRALLDATARGEHTSDDASSWYYPPSLDDATQRARMLFEEQFAEQRGWDIQNLSWEQQFEIRTQPGWVHLEGTAGVAGDRS